MLLPKKKFLGKSWGNVSKRMNYPAYNHENMLIKSYISISLILSSSSLEYGVRKYLKDAKGYLGISKSWTLPCKSLWAFLNGGITTCYPKEPKETNCTALSVPYNVHEAKELYINIQTETRNCKNITDSSCTGKFILSVHYQINENDFERVILPDEIPKKKFGTGLFFRASDDISFSIEENRKSLQLGFQAPHYCGAIQNVSVYYYLCPAKTNALVDFPEVSAPNKSLSPYISVGTCTKNAVKKSSSQRLSMTCYYNGTFEVFGGCECEAGYTKETNICIG